MLHLFASDSFKMVFEHLQNYLHLNFFVNGLSQLFHLCSHIAQGHISRRIINIIGAAHLLTMTKPLSGVCPIVVGEVLYLTHKAAFYAFNFMMPL
jgi:hypothetical protein